MLTSIIVCTHNRSTLLRRAYDHNFAVLERYSAAFEIIFVISACTDDSEAVATRLLQDHDVRGQVAISDEAGLSIARNLGMGRATGDFFWFLDDDVFLAPSWPQHVIRSAETHEIAGGRTLPFSSVPSELFGSEAARTFLSLVDLGCADRPFARHQGPVGANFGFSRARWNAAGCPVFQRTLGRVGSSLRSGEEVAFVRALGSPERPHYLAQATALHWIEPERFDARWWERRLTAEAESVAASKDRLRLCAIAGIHGIRGLFSLNRHDRRVRLGLATRILRRCQ